MKFYLNNYNIKTKLLFILFDILFVFSYINNMFYNLTNYWIWAIFGLFLISLELITLTFYLFCFGISAIVLAVFISIFDISFKSQLFVYIIFSIISLIFVKYFFKRDKKDLKIGQSNDIYLDTIGTIKLSSNNEELTIVFKEPILGSKKWLILNTQNFKDGELAKIIGLEGNYLKVEKVNV